MVIVVYLSFLPYLCGCALCCEEPIADRIAKLKWEMEIL